MPHELPLLFSSCPLRSQSLAVRHWPNLRAITRQPACERAALNQNVIESLRTDAQAVRRELHLLIKGPAANLDKMKVVELDELIDRLQAGDTVSFEEVDEAMLPRAIFMALPP
jgi:hypothetical protein